MIPGEFRQPEGPPPLFVRFFRWFCHPAMRAPIEGDLRELHGERQQLHGRHYANFRFVVDVLLLFRPGIVKSLSGSMTLNQFGMLSSYFRIAWRNLVKYRVFSAINVFGLAVAMSVCMLIMLMLADQLRYDTFHEKGDRTYRILSGTVDGSQPYATSPFPLAAALKSDYSIIENSVTVMPGPAGDAITPTNAVDMRGYFTGSSFFDVFGFQLERGDATTALSQPNTIVITTAIAKQLFGYEDPLGKSIEFSDRQLSFPVRSEGTSGASVPWGTFTITGLIDESKYKSHLVFDVLMSATTAERLVREKKWTDMSNTWDSYWRPYTYAVLKKDAMVADLSRSLDDLVKRKFANIKTDYTNGFYLKPQAMSDIQLGLTGNDTNNRLPDLGYYILGVLAVIIMLTACLNYTNLSIARALTRVREIGVRKVNGATRWSLVTQFLGESILTSLLALLVASVILVFLRWSFKNLWLNQFLQFELPATSTVIVPFLLFAIFIGAIAGLYPAVHLSRFDPVKVLKRIDVSRPGKLGLRKSLTVIQFVISLVFITTSILVFAQFKYYMNFNYGFNHQSMVNVELQGIAYEKLANEMSSVPGVIAVSGCDNLPAGGRTNGDELRKSGTSDEFSQVYIMLASSNFLDNIGVHIVAGKPVPKPGEGSKNEIVVNEATVRKFGFKFPEEIIGHVFESKWSKESLVVIGVVEDFKHQSLINRHEISPLMIRNEPQGFRYLNVRLANADQQAILESMEQKWKQVDPLHPIIVKYYDEELSGTHRALFDVVRIIGFIAAMAIVISCLGLLGMTTYTAERKKKEVGIRKVLGAGSRTIAVLLSGEFVITLGLAIGVGAPLSYFVNNLWLQEIPNRVEFSMFMFFAGVLFLAIVGVATIVSQTVRVSRVNPASVLKEE